VSPRHPTDWTLDRQGGDLITVGRYHARRLHVSNANQLLELLTTELARDEASKRRIKSYYSNYKQKMTVEDARMFASVKFLADSILARNE
jgi:hypothetical protein